MDQLVADGGQNITAIALRLNHQIAGEKHIVIAHSLVTPFISGREISERPRWSREKLGSFSHQIVKIRGPASAWNGRPDTGLFGVLANDTQWLSVIGCMVCMPAEALKKAQLFEPRYAKSACM
jgi:hypothetical protein